MKSTALAIMAAILIGWIGTGVLVVAYGTPVGVTFYVPAIVATNSRIWRRH